jgi:LPXTG-motif cell wall-anchored protein
MTSTTAAPGGSDATATGSGSLPRTGSDQSGIVTAGLCAIAVGLVLVFGARRRSARA